MFGFLRGGGRDQLNVGSQSSRKSLEIPISTIGGGVGDVTYLSPFWEGMAQKYFLPGTYLTNPLVKYDKFGASLPTM